MPPSINVGRIDQAARIVLGSVCVGLFVYHFAVTEILAIWQMLVLIVLIPFFLKTGFTRVCPVMKAMGVTTAGEEASNE